MVYEQQAQIEQLNSVIDRLKINGDAQKLVIQTLSKRMETLETTRTKTSVNSIAKG